jgi:hypothetical protein
MSLFKKLFLTLVFISFSLGFFLLTHFQVALAEINTREAGALLQRQGVSPTPKNVNIYRTAINSGMDNSQAVANVNELSSHTIHGSLWPHTRTSSGDWHYATAAGNGKLVFTPNSSFQPAVPNSAERNYQQILPTVPDRPLVQSPGSVVTPGNLAPGSVSLPYTQVNYANPLRVNSFTALIGGFLAKLQAIIGWLAVIMIVVGGIVYITSAGRSSQLELGKKIITFALLGFAIAVAAPSILKEIMNLASGGQGSVNNNVISRATDIRIILANILRWIISLVGVIATIGFVVSGFNFIIAGGDTGRADKARKGLMYSIIGVVVAGLALILVKQVLILLGMTV